MLYSPESIIKNMKLKGNTQEEVKSALLESGLEEDYVDTLLEEIYNKD